MRRLLPILMIVAVFWCSVHSLMADHALADMGNAACDQAAENPDDARDSSGGPTKPDHGGHHHCPVAPDRSGLGSESAPLLADRLVFTPPAIALHSHSQAPPLQPPSA